MLKGYSLTSHVHSQYLTAVPSDYKTYAATLSSLSSTYSLTSHNHTGYVSKAELKTALASVGQIPSGDGANLENTIAKFNALFAALSALTD